MKRLIILAGLVVLGSIIAIALYYPLAFGILEFFRSRSGRSPESYLGIAFLIFLGNSGDAIHNY